MANTIPLAQVVEDLSQKTVGAGTAVLIVLVVVQLLIL